MGLTAGKNRQQEVETAGQSRYKNGWLWDLPWEQRSLAVLES